MAQIFEVGLVGNDIKNGLLRAFGQVVHIIEEQRLPCKHDALSGNRIAQIAKITVVGILTLRITFSPC